MKFRTLFKRQAKAGGKEANMAEAATTATPPATSGGLDQEAINKAVAEALKPLADTVKTLADGHKSLANVVAGLTPKETDAKDAPKVPTAEETKQLIADGIAAALKSQQTTAEQTAARETFKSTRLKNFPAAYADRLGNDPAKWEDEAKSIAGQFKTDGEKFGWKAPAVGGETPGGAPPAQAAPDLSKMSPQQLAEMALKTSKPVGAPSPAAAAT